MWFRIQHSLSESFNRSFNWLVQNTALFSDILYGPVSGLSAGFKRWIPANSWPGMETGLRPDLIGQNQQWSSPAVK